MSAFVFVLFCFVLSVCLSVCLFVCLHWTFEMFKGTMNSFLKHEKEHCLKPHAKIVLIFAENVKILFQYVV